MPPLLKVPDTNTFTLQDVASIVYNIPPFATGGKTLDDCFDDADSAKFDPTYNTSSYAPANSLLRFRNYGGVAVFYVIVANPDFYTFAFDDYLATKVFNISINPDATFSVGVTGATSYFTVTANQLTNTITVRCDAINSGEDRFITINVTRSGYTGDTISVIQTGSGGA